MERNRDFPYMTPEQFKIKDEFIEVFFNIAHGRNSILQHYKITGNHSFLHTVSKKASFVAVGEISWERAIDSIVKSLERTFTNHLLYIWDKQERTNFINDAYEFIREVEKLKSQRPAVLDNLPPPFRIKLQPEPPNDTGSEE